MNEPCVLLVLLALLDGGGGGRYAGSIRVGFHKRTVLSFAPVIQYLPSAVVWYATRWIEIEVRKYYFSECTSNFIPILNSPVNRTIWIGPSLWPRSSATGTDGRSMVHRELTLSAYCKRS